MRNNKVDAFVHIGKDQDLHIVTYILGYCDLQYAINFDTVTRFRSFVSKFDIRNLREILVAIQKLSLIFKWDDMRFNEVCNAIECVAFNGRVDETSHLVISSVASEVISINKSCADAINRLAHAGNGVLILNSKEIELSPIQGEHFSAVDRCLR